MLDALSQLNMETVAAVAPEHASPVYLQPVEGKTGMNDDPCLVYGNGVEIETVVRYKSPLEKVILESNGNTRQHLAQQGGTNARGVDIVKVHFLPKTSLAERASDPALVAQEEKEKIKVDCIQGFMSLAHGLVKNEVAISDHQPTDDFYLLADTNPGLALFLINSCGFRGNARSGQAWVRASEFSTQENIDKMLNFYKSLVEKNS